MHEEPSRPGYTYLIVAGHADCEPWKSILRNGQMETWMSSINEFPNTELLNSFGKPVGRIINRFDRYLWNLRWNKYTGKLFLAFDFLLQRSLNSWIPDSKIEFNTEIKTNTLRLDMPDLDHLLARKTFAIFKYFVSTDHSFLVLTTTSSYLSIENLEIALAKVDTIRFVGGRVVQQEGGNFPSGTFRILSRKVIEELIENVDEMEFWLPEDLAIGRLLKKLGYELTPLQSIDLDTHESIANLDSKEAAEVIHFRLKSGPINSRNDVHLMKSLENKLAGLK